MKSNAICPISTKKIDDHVARINGVITLLLLLAFIVTKNIIPLLFLTIDFALRSGYLSHYSIFSFLSRKVISAFSLKPLLINAGPKIFAARIGLFFSIMITSFFLLGWENLVYVFSSIFGICAFLESAFGFCVACQIYPFVYRFFYRLILQSQ